MRYNISGYTYSELNSAGYKNQTTRVLLKELLEQYKLDETDENKKKKLDRFIGLANDIEVYILD
jgi:hypothetical protein